MTTGWRWTVWNGNLSAFWTSVFYPVDPDAPKKLRTLVAQQPRIMAMRFHAHRGKADYLESFSEAGVIALWETAAELGLWVELQGGYLPSLGVETFRNLINDFRISTWSMAIDAMNADMDWKTPPPVSPSGLPWQVISE